MSAMWRAFAWSRVGTDEVIEWAACEVMITLVHQSMNSNDALHAIMTNNQYTAFEHDCNQNNNVSLMLVHNSVLCCPRRLKGSCSSANRSGQKAMQNSGRPGHASSTSLPYGRPASKEWRESTVTSCHSSICSESFLGKVVHVPVL